MDEALPVRLARSKFSLGVSYCHLQRLGTWMCTQEARLRFVEHDGERRD